MKKLIIFDDNLVSLIQSYANKNFDGNFNAAVRFLCSKVIEHGE